MPEGYDASITVHVIEGRAAGPTVAIIAAQHGDELSSTMAALGVLKQIDPIDLRGTLLVVPVANPISFSHKQRSTWVDGLYGGGTGNMNRLWPGRPDGFLTERLAFALTTEVVSHADIVIDIHNGIPGGLSIYYGYHFAGEGEAIARANELALAFGIEILIEGEASDVAAAPTLSHFVLRELKRPLVIVELGDFYGFGDAGEKSAQPVRQAVEAGVTGIINVLKMNQMVPGPVVRPTKQVIVSPERRCQPAQGGILLPGVGKREIGSVFPIDHLLGTVVDPYTGEALDEIRAPYEQNLLLSATASQPYTVVHPGDQGFHVADFSTARWVENSD
jgi:hypothetical protein